MCGHADADLEARKGPSHPDREGLAVSGIRVDRSVLVVAEELDWSRVAVGVGAGVAVGTGVGVGTGVAVGFGAGVAVGTGVSVGVGTGVAVGFGTGVAVGSIISRKLMSST